MTVFRTARGQAAPVGREGGDGCEKPTSQLHTCMEGKVIKEIINFLEWGGGTLIWDHQVGGSGFSGRGFDTAAFFLDVPAASWLWVWRSPIILCPCCSSCFVIG
jgi:hypothetical protein